MKKLETFIAFLDHYNLPWLLLALLSWWLLYRTCSRVQFWHAFPVGSWTALTGAALEQFFIVNKFWSSDFILLQLGELDVFLVIGPFFALGILLVRFLPEGAWSRAFTVLAFSIFAVLIELVAIKFGFLTYHPTRWSHFHSIFSYFLGLASALGFYFMYYNIPRRSW